MNVKLWLLYNLYKKIVTVHIKHSETARILQYIIMYGTSEHFFDWILFYVGNFLYLCLWILPDSGF